MVFPEASEAKAAALGARFEAWILGQEDKLSPDQERWLRVVGSQLRANADTADEFTAGHFAFHPFTLMGGLPEALRIFGGEDGLDSCLQSLNGDVFASRDQEPDADPGPGLRPS